MSAKDALTGGTVGAGTGAAVGTAVFPGIGTAIGGALGALGGALGGALRQPKRGKSTGGGKVQVEESTTDTTPVLLGLAAFGALLVLAD